jgi:hypothetical protein
VRVRETLRLTGLSGTYRARRPASCPQHRDAGCRSTAPVYERIFDPSSDVAAVVRSHPLRAAYCFGASLGIWRNLLVGQPRLFWLCVGCAIGELLWHAARRGPLDANSHVQARGLPRSAAAIGCRPGRCVVVLRVRNLTLKCQWTVACMWHDRCNLVQAAACHCRQSTGGPRILVRTTQGRNCRSERGCGLAL